MPMHESHRLLLTSLIATCLAGCTLRSVEPGEATHEPICFSVHFEVDGDPDERNLRRRRSCYVLEANRDLRVIRGSSAHAQTYPPFVNQLSHAQFHALFRHAVDHELLVEPTSPNAEAPREVDDGIDGNVIYRVAINLNGKWNQYATTPGESPPTVQLLAGLIDAVEAVPSPWRIEP